MDKTQAIENFSVFYKMWPLLAFGLGLFVAYIIIYKLVTADYRRHEIPIVTAEMIYKVLMDWDGVMGESLRQAIVILGPIGVPQLIDHIHELPEGARNALICVWDDEGYLRKYFDQATKGTVQEKITAIEILGKLDWIQSVHPLLEALGDKSDEVRMAASEALSKIQAPEVVPLLIKALEDPYRFLPARIAEVLISYGDVAVPAMLEALPDLPIQSKVYIIEMLGGMDDEKISPALMLELRADEPEIRAASIEALGEQMYKPAAEAMSILLKDKDGKVRSKAARTLGLVGSLQYIPSLEDMLKDEEWWVRTNAETAIEAIRDRNERG